MEVDRISFPGRLLDIIVAVSEAHFVSFDLELSGIPSKGESKRVTLEERYQDVKAAAERYQILQIGLTCAAQDPGADKYTLRPYNFNLNPLLEERLDIERIWSIQSGAADFLLSHGFRMDLPMTHGVPYLSRDEAKKAKKLAYARWDKSHVEDVLLRPDEVESLDFVKNVRIAIDQWRVTGKPAPSYLNITCKDPTGPQPTFPELGNFEKRLVHQLVRAEYPELVTLSKAAGIQIKRYDEEREKSFLESRKRKLKSQIKRQTGFRWIVEALCGGEMDIDPREFARDVHTGEAKYADRVDLEARFFRARAALKCRKPILVGHNLFTDIIYFYRTFIGELPSTLGEFQEKVHELFPVIVDTKYMATHNCGDINPRSSLEEIEEKLRSEPRPVIETHGAHGKYHTKEAFHEAGYDSFLTANIMIRLSTKLEAAGTYIEEQKPAVLGDDSADSAASDGLTQAGDGGVKMASGVVAGSTGFITATLNSITKLLTPPITPTTAAEPAEVPAQAAAPLEDAGLAQSNRAERKKQKNKDRKKKRKGGGAPTGNGGAMATRFSHVTKYDGLAEQSLESEAEDGEEAEGDTGTAKGGWDKRQVEAVEQDGTTYYVPVAPKAEASGPGATGLMPPFETDFWRVYGNKLRVFGTVENVWRLAEWGGVEPSKA